MVFPGPFSRKSCDAGRVTGRSLGTNRGILAIDFSVADRYDTYFLKMDNCKFENMVKPGDTLLLKMELTIHLSVVALWK